MSIARRLFDNLEEILSGTFLAVMFLSIFLGVLFRYVFRLPLSWAEELSRLCFIWLVFIGTSLVAKHGSHITVEVLPESVSPGVRKVFAWTAKVLVVITAVIMIYYGSKLMIKGFWMPTSMLQIPWGFIYLSVPLGGVLSLYRIFQNRPAGANGEEGGLYDRGNGP